MTQNRARAANDEEWSDWTTEALLDYEERLYDEEVAGEDTWFLRDKILIELNRRDFK